MPSWTGIFAVPSIIAIVCAGSLPFIYRMLSSKAPLLVWECDSALLFFSAFAEGQGPWDFTKYVLLNRQGVLSASAHTLFWGVPTYAVMKWIGWNMTTFLSMSLLCGLASIIVGGLCVRLLFNAAVALCFVVIFAANPSLVFNMGYGVAQTGTLLAVLLAVFFTFRALLRDGARWIDIPLAIVFLFGATMNYGPGRVFVVTTLLFLLGIVVVGCLWRRLPKKLVISALLVCVGATGALVTENRLNPAADFSSMRGEHAFYQHQWKENLIRILGDTPEVQALDPNNLPTMVRARFIVYSGLRGLEQFLNWFSPLNRLDMQRRGPSIGDDMRPYQSGLFPFVVIGFCASLISVIRAIRGAAGTHALAHTFVFAFFFVSLAPLSLTNRLDLHRAFLLVLPWSMWAALGMWICFRRAYNCGTPALVLGVFALAFSAALSAATWRTLGVQEVFEPELDSLFKEVMRAEPPVEVIGSVGLICQLRGVMEMRAADQMQSRIDGPPRVKPFRILDALVDPLFASRDDALQAYFEQYGAQRVGFFTVPPMEKFHNELQGRGYRVTTRTAGPFTSWIVDPPATQAP
jgi:hypothetical protein